MIGQSQTGSNSQIIFIALFSLTGAQLLLYFFTSLSKLSKYHGWAKTIFAQPNWDVLGLFSMFGFPSSPMIHFLLSLMNHQVLGKQITNGSHACM
jgi:hypothetical protein